jgi:hypothetical protein
LLKTNSDVSTLPPHWNSNTDTNIYIYVLADTYIGYLGFHFHASLPGCYDQCSNLGKRYRGGVAAQKPWTKQTLALGYQPQPFLCLAASRTHASRLPKSPRGKATPGGQAPGHPHPCAAFAAAAAAAAAAAEA